MSDSGWLDAIEVRLRAATPGPWYWRNTADVYLQGARSKIVMAFSRRGMQGAQPEFRDEQGLLNKAGNANLYDYPDAEFIAHAPEDIAALVAAVRERDAALARVEALAENPAYLVGAEGVRPAALRAALAGEGA